MKQNRTMYMSTVISEEKVNFDVEMFKKRFDVFATLRGFPSHLAGLGSFPVPFCNSPPTDHTSAIAHT